MERNTHQLFMGHGSLLIKRQFGLTLVELIVVLAVLSILAAAALPFAEVTIQRSNEYELKQALREIRMAIDEFHSDWLNGRISQASDAASEYGYPVSLEVLVQGVELSGVSTSRRYYLRRIPYDPFADKMKPPEEQWVLRSYSDAPDSIINWGGEDVYDVYSSSQQEALDGTMLQDW